MLPLFFKYLTSPQKNFFFSGIRKGKKFLANDKWNTNCRRVEKINYKATGRIQKKQFRYKGGICFSDEKYVTDKMVVELKGEIHKDLLADLLKKLDYVGKQNYISKMNEMQDIAKKAYYDHCNFKHDYQASHESDDTIIDTYRGSRSRKK